MTTKNIETIDPIALESVDGGRVGLVANDAEQEQFDRCFEQNRGRPIGLDACVRQAEEDIANNPLTIIPDRRRQRREPAQGAR